MSNPHTEGPALDSEPASQAAEAAERAAQTEPQIVKPASARTEPPNAKAATTRPLPNMRGVGAMMVGVEEKLLGRQPVQDVVEEHSLHNRRTVGGVTLEFGPEPPQRPAPKDRSGAKL